MTKQFTITFECENDAFGDDMPGAIAGVLKDYANQIARYGIDENSVRTVFDVNGNEIGKQTFEEV